MASKGKKASKHKPVSVVMLILTILVYGTSLLLSYLGDEILGQQLGIFTNNTEFGEGSRRNYVDISPAFWTFSIWTPIYIWQGLWLLYALVGVFRKNSRGEPMYSSPELQTPLFYCSFILNRVASIVWRILEDRREIGWSLVPLLLIPFTMYVCLVISHMRLNANGNLMKKTGLHVDIWLTRLFVQNGLAFFAAWATIACLLSFAGFLAYIVNAVDQSVASTISLSILAVELAIWVILDIFVLERYLRYQFSQYIVVIVALVGIISRNYTPCAINSIFTVVLLIVTGIATVVKIFMMIYRHFTRPLFNEDNYEPDSYDNEAMAKTEL